MTASSVLARRPITNLVAAADEDRVLARRALEAARWCPAPTIGRRGAA